MFIFLTDSLQLVNLLNSQDPPDLPDWRMTPMIQMFQDYTRDRNSSVLKIDTSSIVLQIP
jgi:hypothetical protein